jgi:hypothetical protein
MILPQIKTWLTGKLEKIKLFGRNLIIFYQKNKKIIYIVFFGVIAVAVAILLILLTIKSKQQKPDLAPIESIQKDLITATFPGISLLPTPTPKPTPIPLKPDKGTQGTYRVSQGKHEGPTFLTVILDPLDVQKNQTLTIKVDIKTDSVIEKVTGVLEMDNSQANLIFQKINSKNNIDTWQAKLTLKDTVLYKYILSISAKDGAGEAKMKMPIRS